MRCSPARRGTGASGAPTARAALGAAGLALALAAAAPVLVALGAAGPALAQERRGPDPRAFDEAWRLLRESFYERGFHGVDWQAARDRHRPRAVGAKSQEEVHEAILAMFAELKASHAAVVEEDVYRNHYDNEAKSLLAPTFGVKLTRVDDGYWVSDCVQGGPAAAAGLLRGDRVLTVNGQPPEDAGLRPLPWDAGLGGPRSYVLPTSAAGQTARLELQRFPRPKGLFQASLTSADWSELEGSRVSQRVVEVLGRRVGTTRLYHMLSEEPVDGLAHFLARLDDAHAFVLDVRGQGGLPSAVERTLDLFDPNAPGGPLWGRPAVLVVDGETRSAKEVLAYEWRRRRIGPVVGARTRGAVLGARFERLSDGAQVLLPALDMRTLTGGEVIEGVGVPPDVEVQATLPWAEGRDPCFERGLEVAASLALEVARRGRKQGWY